MAKGDSSRAQKTIDTQGPLAQNYLTSVQNQVGQQAQQSNNMYYGTGGGGSYGNQPQQQNGRDPAAFIAQWQQTHSPTEGKAPLIAALQQAGFNASPYMYGNTESGNEISLDGQRYKVFSGDEGASNSSWYVPGTEEGGIAGGAIRDYGNIMDQYQQFAKTGGYSPEDLANIRARAVSPIRSVYASAREGVERNKALQGGYAPNYNAAMAKLAREQGFATSNASTNVEGALAEMVQRGKLAGLGGMSGMFGTTPGMANMFGNQMLAGQNNLLQGAGLQNQLGLGLMGAQIDKGARVQGNFGQVVDNIGGIVKPIAQIGGAIAGAGA